MWKNKKTQRQDIRPICSCAYGSRLENTSTFLPTARHWRRRRKNKNNWHISKSICTTTSVIHDDTWTIWARRKKRTERRTDKRRDFFLTFHMFTLVSLPWSPPTIHLPLVPLTQFNSFLFGFIRWFSLECVIDCFLFWLHVKPHMIFLILLRYVQILGCRRQSLPCSFSETFIF